jgi:drug/metabolite transporter (DMT)-like permease
MVMVTAILAVLPRVWRSWRSLSPRLVAAYAGAGAIVALHWLTFYGAIKLSNASVAVTCIALSPVFLALVEPLIARRAFDPRELLLGVAVVPGVVLAVGGIPSGMHTGFVVGVVSAMLVAVFGAINKRLVDHADPLAVTGLELGAGVALLAVVAPFLPHAGPLFPIPDARDTLLLATLAVACTLLPFTLSLVALRHLSAFGAQLAVNLEPLYTIVIAAALLGERQELTPRFHLGVAIILAVVFAYPFLTRRRPTAPAVEVVATAEH